MDNLDTIITDIKAGKYDGVRLPEYREPPDIDLESCTSKQFERFCVKARTWLEARHIYDKEVIRIIKQNRKLTDSLFERIGKPEWYSYWQGMIPATGDRDYQTILIEAVIWLRKQ